MMSSKRSMQTVGNSQISHSSVSHAGSRSGLYGTGSKRNVAFDSKLDKAPPKKATIQVWGVLFYIYVYTCLLYTSPSPRDS